MREVQNNPFGIHQPVLSHSLICRNRAGHAHSRLPRFWSLLWLQERVGKLRVLKSAHFSSSACRWFYSRGSLQHPSPPTSSKAKPAVNGNTLESCLPTLKPCKTHPREARSKPCRTVLCLRCSALEFPWSFCRRGWEGKAEVQAARHGSCTTDLYTCIPPPCGLKCTGRKFSTSLWQCQVKIQMVIPKGTCLQGLPRCNSSLLQPRQQLGVVLICPLLRCLCWARVHLASPGNQQSAWMWDMERCAASFWGVSDSSESPSPVSCPQQLVAQPQLTHPALPMYTQRGQGGICSTLLPQPLTFYSFTLSTHKAKPQDCPVVGHAGKQSQECSAPQTHV